MSTALNAINKKGRFTRSVSKHRDFVKIGSDQFPPEADRYHVHIALGELLFVNSNVIAWRH